MRVLSLAVLGLALAAPPSSAAEAAAPHEGRAKAKPKTEKADSWGAVRSWLERFKEGLTATSAERYRQKRSVVAVAAVRGAGQRLDDPGKPYIKGSSGDAAEKQRRKERAELAAAVDLILQGKIEEGKRKLDEFEAAHPQSVYLPEARQAREKLQSLPAGAAPPPAPAEPPQPAPETRKPAEEQAQPKSHPPESPEAPQAPDEPESPGAPQAPDE